MGLEITLTAVGARLFRISAEARDEAVRAANSDHLDNVRALFDEQRAPLPDGAGNLVPALRGGKIVLAWAPAAPEVAHQPLPPAPAPLQQPAHPEPA